MLKGLFVLYVSDLYGFDVEACYPEDLIYLRRTIGACIGPFLMSESEEPELLKFPIGDYYYISYSNQAKYRRILSLMTDDAEDLELFEAEFNKLINKIYSTKDFQQYQSILKESFETFLEIQNNVNREKL